MSSEGDLFHSRVPALAAPALLLIAFAANHASAHAIVVSAQPAMNASVAAGDLDVRIEFNSRIDPRRSRLDLVAPDATVTPVALAPETTAGVLTARARTTTAGRWTLRWQVLSVDGHITRGRIDFVVRSDGPR